jgi:hypothetical protein
MAQASYPITTQSFPEFLTGVRAKFHEVIDQDTKSAQKYSVAKLFESLQDVSPLIMVENLEGTQKADYTFIPPLAGYLEPREELEPLPETFAYKGIITSVQPYEYAIRLRVSFESIERQDSDYKQKLNWASKLKSNLERTLSMHTFSFFNNVRTDPANLPQWLFTYNDGKKIASTQHPLANGEVGSNILANSPALSDIALESALLLAYNWKDDAGKPMPYFGGKIYIITAPENAKKLFEILETPNVPYTSNFVANVFYGTGRYVGITSPYLSQQNGGKSTRFILVDGEDSPIRQLIFKAPYYNEWQDYNVYAYVFDVMAAWKIGNIDWRGIVVSEGDNSTITD